MYAVGILVPVMILEVLCSIQTTASLLTSLLPRANIFVSIKSLLFMMHKASPFSSLWLQEPGSLLFTIASSIAQSRYSTTMISFGISGPRELSGAVDLISRYKLLNHHSFFCKKPLPLAISDTNYLNNVVGDTEIRKGEGMELDQLFQNSYSSEKTAYIQPFDMEILGQAFQLRETAPVDLPSVRYVRLEFYVFDYIDSSLLLK